MLSDMIDSPCWTGNMPFESLITERKVCRINTVESLQAQGEYSEATCAHSSTPVFIAKKLRPSTCLLIFKSLQ